jgi:hypothetical protein
MGKNNFVFNNLENHVEIGAGAAQFCAICRKRFIPQTGIRSDVCASCRKRARRTGFFHIGQATKNEARKQTTKAINAGLLCRPHRCAGCGKHRVQLPRRCGRYAVIEAHHHGYVCEAILDVVWLCTACHKQADKLQRAPA